MTASEKTRPLDLYETACLAGGPGPRDRHGPRGAGAVRPRPRPPPRPAGDRLPGAPTSGRGCGPRRRRARSATAPSTRSAGAWSPTTGCWTSSAGCSTRACSATPTGSCPISPEGDRRRRRPRRAPGPTATGRRSRRPTTSRPGPTRCSSRSAGPIDCPTGRSGPTSSRRHGRPRTSVAAVTARTATRRPRRPRWPPSRDTGSSMATATPFSPRAAGPRPACPPPADAAEVDDDRAAPGPRPVRHRLPRGRSRPGRRHRARGAGRVRPHPGARAGRTRGRRSRAAGIRSKRP